jgi:hypothetical protein
MLNKVNEQYDKLLGIEPKDKSSKDRKYTEGQMAERKNIMGGRRRPGTAQPGGNRPPGSGIAKSSVTQLSRRFDTHKTLRMASATRQSTSKVQGDASTRNLPKNRHPQSAYVFRPSSKRIESAQRFREKELDKDLADIYEDEGSDKSVDEKDYNYLKDGLKPQYTSDSTRIQNTRITNTGNTGQISRLPTGGSLQGRPGSSFRPKTAMHPLGKQGLDTISETTTHIPHNNFLKKSDTGQSEFSQTGGLERMDNPESTPSPIGQTHGGFGKTRSSNQPKNIDDDHVDDEREFFEQQI